MQELLRIMNRTILLWSLITVAFLAATDCALAARIYNNTAVTVWISGRVNPLDVGSGKRSESLEWKGTHFITVGYQDEKRVHHELCRLGKAIGNDLVGGNYLLINQSGRRVNCSLCDSNHNALYRDSGQFPVSVPNKTSSQGC